MTFDEYADEAYELGIRDFERGLSMDDNPYNEENQSAGWFYWRKGWRFANQKEK